MSEIRIKTLLKVICIVIDFIRRYRVGCVIKYHLQTCREESNRIENQSVSTLRTCREESMLVGGVARLVHGLQLLWDAHRRSRSPRPVLSNGLQCPMIPTQLEDLNFDRWNRTRAYNADLQNMWRLKLYDFAEFVNAVQIWTTLQSLDLFANNWNGKVWLFVEMWIITLI